MFYILKSLQVVSHIKVFRLRRLHVNNPMQLDVSLALALLLRLLRACEQRGHRLLLNSTGV